MKIKPGEIYKSVVEDHLWIPVCEPCADGTIVVASITSHRATKDQTCPLTRDDWAYLDHDSLIHYRGAMLMDAVVMDTKISDGSVRILGSVTASALLRIIQGFKDSIHSPPRCQIRLREKGLII